jgi:membrane carboxypeptidase/penicillin-binding protein
MLKQMQKYSPTLNTVIMVENTLKNSDNAIITIPQLKKLLPKQVNHNTLKHILEYLQESNKIYISIKGITWIHNTNKNLQKAIKNGFEL